MQENSNLQTVDPVVAYNVPGYPVYRVVSVSFSGEVTKSDYTDIEKALTESSSYNVFSALFVKRSPNLNFRLLKKFVS